MPKKSRNRDNANDEERSSQTTPPPSADEQEDSTATATLTADGDTPTERGGAGADVDPGLLHGTLDDADAGDDQTCDEDQDEGDDEGTQRTGVADDPIRTALIEVPTLPIADGYSTRNLRDLSVRHARILRGVLEALKKDGATVDGLPVRDNADAVAWILEQVTASIQ